MHYFLMGSHSSKYQKQIERNLAYVSALIKEMAEQRKRDQAERKEELKRAEEELKIAQAELRKTLAETSREVKETTRKVNEVAKLHGQHVNSLGEILEEKFYQSLRKNPVIGGIRYNKVSKQMKVLDQAEFDLLLANGDTLAAVEVKHRLRKADVMKLAEQLPKLHLVKPYDKFKLYGVVAGQVIYPDAKAEAQKQGFYIIQETPNGIECLNSPRFKPIPR